MVEYVMCLLSAAVCILSTYSRSQRVIRASPSQGAVPLTDAQKMEIVNIHNELRKSSGSSNMRYMTWDSELEWVAESYGKKCRYGHNKNIEHSRYSSVGENIYASIGKLSTFDVTRPIQMWFNEISDFDYGTRTCQPNKACGHYVQVVWAKSFKVGCSLTFCDYLSEIKFSNSMLFICNYATSGNIVNPKGQLYSVFDKGPACTKCGAGDYCRDALCANSKRDFINERPVHRPESSKVGLIIAVVVLTLVVILLVAFIIFRERRIIFDRFRLTKPQICNDKVPSTTQPANHSQPTLTGNNYELDSLLVEDGSGEVESGKLDVTEPRRHERSALQICAKVVPVKPRMPPPSVPAPVLKKT